MITFRIGLCVYVHVNLIVFIPAYVCTYTYILMFSVTFVALAVYTRSPTAHEAICGFGILQLLSVSTLKTFIDFNYEKPGLNEEHLRHAHTQYDEMIRGRRAAGQSVPFSEGLLTFDEVKTRSRQNRPVYLTGKISSDKVGSLHYVYQTLQPDHRTQKPFYAPVPVAMYSIYIRHNRAILYQRGGAKQPIPDCYLVRSEVRTGAEWVPHQGGHM